MFFEIQMTSGGDRPLWKAFHNGQLPPFVVSAKPPPERLLHFETCRMGNSHNLA
jgi:hypothetical protein